MTTSDNLNEYYKKVSNTELLDVLENEEDYQPLAVKAAKIEFENRQLSDDEIRIAKEPLIERRLTKKNREHKALLIEDKVKAFNNSLLETLDQIQTKTPSDDKLIQTITIVFAGMFFYQLISSYRMLTLMIKDVSKFDSSSFLYFLPFVVLPIATLTFWRRKKIGWTMLSFFVIYTGIETFHLLLESFTRRHPQLASFDNIFPRQSPITTIIQLFFLGGALYVLCKSNIRKVFKIESHKMTAIITISAIVTFFLMFAIA